VSCGGRPLCRRHVTSDSRRIEIDTLWVTGSRIGRQVLDTPGAHTCIGAGLFMFDVDRSATCIFMARPVWGSHFLKATPAQFRRLQDFGNKSLHRPDVADEYETLLARC